jgi:hypothetical protein
MKRTLLIFSLILLINFDIYSQVTDVVTNLSSPRGLVIHNGKLYISEEGTNKVLEFDLTTENTNDFVASLVIPIGLLQRGNDLLIAENNGFKVSRKDLTLPPSTATDYITFQTPPFVEPWGIELSQDQNTLYISEVGGRIYKADLTQTNPMPELIWQNTDGTAIDLALNGNDLYISESENQTGQLGRILKIDVTDMNPTPIEVVTNLYFPIGLEIIGTELFFTNWNEQANGTDTLNKIALNDTNPQVTTVLTSLNFPTYLTYSNGELYISQDDRVSKIPETQLGIDELNTSLDFNIYPNPVNDFISLTNSDFTSEFEIYDVLGNRLSNGNLTDKIDVTNLSAGIYFLKIEQTINRFIKK